MGTQQFCNVENEPFDAKAFVQGPKGVLIHVIDERAGHTVDGVTAHLRASQTGDRWTVDEVTFPNVDNLQRIAWISRG